MSDHTADPQHSLVATTGGPLARRAALVQRGVVLAASLVDGGSGATKAPPPPAWSAQPESLRRMWEDFTRGVFLAFNQGQLGVLVDAFDAGVDAACEVFGITRSNEQQPAEVARTLYSAAAAAPVWTSLDGSKGPIFSNGTNHLIALLESRDDFRAEWQEYVVENELDGFVDALETFLFEVWRLATPDGADPFLARHVTGFVVGSRAIARAKSRIGRSTSDGTSIEVVLPALAAQSADATIDRWFKRPGDLVQRDEPLLRLTAGDDLAAWIPSPVSGTLAEVRAENGATVSFNTVVGVITIA